MSSSGDRPPSQRPLRVGEAMRHALIDVLTRGHVRDPDLAGVSITVSEVRMSPDLRHATAFVLPLGGQDAPAVLKALKRATPFLRHAAVRQLDLRRAPELHFQLDESFDAGQRIGAALRAPHVAQDLAPPPARRRRQRKPA